MKIVHLLPSIDFGGTERMLLTLAQEQKKGGHEVHIISFTQRNSYLEMSKGLNIIHLEGVSVLWKWNKTIATKLELLENCLTIISPDIIHSHSFWTELIVYSLQKIEKVQYVTHFHLFYSFYKKKSILSPSYLGHNYILRRLFRKYKSYKTKFIVVSSNVEEYYSSHFPSFLRQKLHLLPNGIDLELFPYSSRSSEKELTSLLTVGRLSEEKNYSFLLDIAKNLKESGLSFRWYIAGEGTWRSEFEKQIKNNQLEEFVFLIGQVQDMSSLYTTSDLYVHTSLKESFGMVFLECMASGLPSVSLRAGGNEDIISNGQEGRLLESRTTAEEFSESIIETLTDHTSYEKYVKNGLEKAKQFSVYRYEMKIEELYLSR